MSSIIRQYTWCMYRRRSGFRVSGIADGYWTGYWPVVAESGSSLQIGPRTLSLFFLIFFSDFFLSSKHFGVFPICFLLFFLLLQLRCCGEGALWLCFFFLKHQKSFGAVFCSFSPAVIIAV